jgi:hypothetical protein
LWLSLMIATFTCRIIIYFADFVGWLITVPNEVVLFPWQCSWYSVLADVVHLHVLTEDSVAASNQNSLPLHHSYRLMTIRMHNPCTCLTLSSFRLLHKLSSSDSHPFLNLCCSLDSGFLVCCTM